METDCNSNDHLCCSSSLSWQGSVQSSKPNINKVNVASIREKLLEKFHELEAALDHSQLNESKYQEEIESSTARILEELEHVNQENVRLKAELEQSNETRDKALQHEANLAEELDNCKTELCQLRQRHKTLQNLQKHTLEAYQRLKRDLMAQNQNNEDTDDDITSAMCSSS